MASPHVAGAAAVRSAGNLLWNALGDKDGTHETLLNVAARARP